MDEKVPTLKPNELIKALKKADFYPHHQTGSHLVMKHKIDKDKRVIIPRHNKDLKKGTFRNILKQAGLTNDDFLKLLCPSGKPA